jgi:hypothetical protein
MGWRQLYLIAEAPLFIMTQLTMMNSRDCQPRMLMKKIGQQPN